MFWTESTNGVTIELNSAEGTAAAISLGTEATLNASRNQTRKAEKGRPESGGDYVRLLAAVLGRRAGKKNQGNSQNSAQGPP